MTSSETLEKKRILIAGVQVPYTSGGAELLVETLRAQIVQQGHEVDVIQLPFNSENSESLLDAMLMWSNLDISHFYGKPVDQVICTKFPSYLLKHQRKSVWLVHQHRQFYDLFGTRFGIQGESVEEEAMRQILYDADRLALGEAEVVTTISPNVSRRLKKYLGLDSLTLLPPLPMGIRYRTAQTENYILSVGRICSIKRVDLLIKCLPQVDPRLSVKIVGKPDEPGTLDYLLNEVDKHHLWHRVSFLGRVSEEELLELFARARAVYYAPFDEDYGFVTLEALASGRPVITAEDSGGVLEFIQNGFNGVIAKPQERSMASAINRLIQDDEFYESLLANCRDSLPPISWENVLQGLHI